MQNPFTIQPFSCDNEVGIVRCVICQESITLALRPFTADYAGTAYYLCSETCYERFKARIADKQPINQHKPKGDNHASQITTPLCKT